MGTEMALATAEAKKTEQILVDNIAKVSGEVISLKANQIRVNLKVKEELSRVEGLSNHRFTEAKRARGKLRQLMDENKQAASEEVKALSADLHTKIAKLRHENNANKIEMQKDLTEATTTFYEKMSAVQKANMEAVEGVNAATAAATLAAKNELARAQAGFESKIVMLTNTIAANAKKAEDGMARLTGVVHSTAKAAAEDRELIKEQTKAMEADLNKALNRAISLVRLRPRLSSSALPSTSRTPSASSRSSSTSPSRLPLTTCSRSWRASARRSPTTTCP